MAPSPKPAKKQEDEVVRELVQQIREAEKPHLERVARFKKMDDVYNAVLSARTDNWTSSLHPPYAYQMVETIRANLVDDMPTERITPLSPQWEKGAEAHERIIQAQRRADHFGEKQPDWITQGLVRGISPAKVAWDYQRRDCTYPVFTSSYGGGATRTERTEPRTLVNRATFIPVDACDFWWNPSATSVDDWERVYYRTYDTIDTLREMEKAGVYKNVSDVTKHDQQAIQGRDVKGRVEVIERWSRTRLTVIANRQVLLRDDPNPFWHQEIPFVVATPSPIPFKIHGKGIVELIADIQAALWDLQNQRIDNTRLINNSIMYYQEGSIDEDQLKDRFPGKYVPVNQPPNSAVMFEQPNASIIGPSVQAEEILKRDLQDIVGAVAYVSGAAQETVDQKTATGISIIQNMAQRRLLSIKQQYGYALKRAGFQQLKLNQQFLKAPVVMPVIQSTGFDWPVYQPQDLQGEYEYDIEDLTESLNRQERRAEAQAKIQSFLAVAPVFGPTATQTIDFKGLLRDLTEAFGEDPNKYLLEAPSAPAMAPPGLAPGMPPTGPPATPPPGAVAPAPIGAPGAAGGPPLPMAPPGVAA